ncbi:uncharacterized protein LOC121199931 [Toxotes jaculatrix]|uniref:uncharacterized protein LOC121199931 n=1 Tax=Toxotes jaculatrix TaxID=941984 RepID=UPI001B3ADFE1|nr:uncharacterized protein LOC121199931 [Toxotes jaculatrix]
MILLLLTVKWLYEGETVDEGNKDIETQSQSVCSATVTFPSSYLKKPKYDELFKCEVTDGYSTEEKLFTFSPQSSAVIGQFSSVTVRDGGDVTLSCENLFDDQDECDSPDWTFRRSTYTAKLVKHGQISEEAKSKSDRLSVTENCSLVIEKVTVEDVGRYDCRQFDESGRQQGPDSVVHLSVVTMTGRKDYDKVTLSCSVSTHDWCRHTVKWLYEGETVDEGNKDIETQSQSVCSATVTFPSSYLKKPKYDELFKCEVTDGYSKEVKLFTFSPQSSAVIGQFSSVTVRDGGDVTLSCENLFDDQDECDSPDWTFRRSTNRAELVKHGQISEEAKSKSDRLSVTENCSLAIEKVTVEDVGRYDCQQFDESGRQQGPDSVVFLSVVTMTEHQDDDEVTLNCSVSTYEQCKHTVKWLYEGETVDKYIKSMMILPSDCSDIVTFTTSHYIYKSKNSESFRCKVTDNNSGNVQQFTFSTSASGQETGWLRVVIVTVGLLVLIISVVAVNTWKRTEGNKTQMDENNVLSGDDDDAVICSSVKAPSSCV